MSPRSRLAGLLREQLTQGVTPRKLALTLALGIALGLFPVLGSTTVLCAIAGLALRLNQPLLQLVNYLMYPVQIALLIPFYRAGEWLFGAEPVPLLSVPDLVQRFRDGPLQFCADYALVGAYGVCVWFLLVVPLASLAYPAFHAAILRLARSSPLKEST